MERARSGQLTESELFTALEWVLTEDLAEAERITREMMTAEAEPVISGRRS